MRGRNSSETPLAAVARAIQIARVRSRGLAPAEAEEHLREAMREEGAFLPEREIATISRLLSDRWLPLKRPFWFHREMMRAMQTSLDDTLEIEFVRALQAIRRALDGAADVRSVESRRTIDGPVHTIELSPWSEVRSEEIRKLVEPIAVSVIPASARRHQDPGSE
jgi:hypothetical protein